MKTNTKNPTNSKVCASGLLNEQDLMLPIVFHLRFLIIKFMGFFLPFSTCGQGDPEFGKCFFTVKSYFKHRM